MELYFLLKQEIQALVPEWPLFEAFLNVIELCCGDYRLTIQG